MIAQWRGQCSSENFWKQTARATGRCAWHVKQCCTCVMCMQSGLKSEVMPQQLRTQRRRRPQKRSETRARVLKGSVGVLGTLWSRGVFKWRAHWEFMLDLLRSWQRHSETGIASAGQWHHLAARDLYCYREKIAATSTSIEGKYLLKGWFHFRAGIFPKELIAFEGKHLLKGVVF